MNPIFKALLKFWTTKDLFKSFVSGGLVDSLCMVWNRYSLELPIKLFHLQKRLIVMKYVIIRRVVY